jgi:hypothetical protein
MEEYRIVNWEDSDEEVIKPIKPKPKVRKTSFPLKLPKTVPIVKPPVKEPDKAELRRLEIESDMDACRDSFGF